MLLGESDARAVDGEALTLQRESQTYSIIAVVSGIAAMSIGILKEIGDEYDIAWNNGQSSWGDILADFIGVILGEIIIFLSLGLRFWIFRRGA